MTDYIDRQASIDAVLDLSEKLSNEMLFIDAIVDEIENIPSAEPERKIIYCKDCKFAHLTIEGRVKYCDVWFPETKMYLSADDFCSSAEKRGEK